MHRSLLLVRRPTASVVRRPAGGLVHRLCSNTSSRPTPKNAVKPAVHPAAEPASTVPSLMSAKAADPAPTATARELEVVEAGRALQKRTIDEGDVAHPSLDKVFATGVVAAAATPAVLLLPTWAPLVLFQSAYSFSDGSGVDGLPLWPLRASLALVGHPAITLTCGTTIALVFALHQSFLNRAGYRMEWRSGEWRTEISSVLDDEAARIGRHVGFASALVSPLAVTYTHYCLTMGWLDGLMPRALVLDYWAMGGPFTSYTYLCVLYMASLPFTTYASSRIAPLIAPLLYANDDGKSLRVLVMWAGAVLAGVTILSVQMHRRWEFSLLRGTSYPGMKQTAADDITDEDGGDREPWLNEEHRAWEYDVAALSKLPGVGPEKARRIDEQVKAGLRGGQRSDEIASELRKLRIEQECKFGPWKHAIKMNQSKRSLEQLRNEENAAYGLYKQQLRHDLWRSMQSASNHERARQLSEAMDMLEGLRQPAAGLSRKQLKVVNGALLVVAKARRNSEAVVPLTDEKTMMRRVAYRHDHGMKDCEEASIAVR